MGRPVHQGTHAGRKIQWGYIYGAAYAEVKRKKAEADFYNLKRTDLTFEALAEVWLHSLQYKRIHLCALFVHTAQVSSPCFEQSACCVP